MLYLTNKLKVGLVLLVVSLAFILPLLVASGVNKKNERIEELLEQNVIVKSTGIITQVRKVNADNRQLGLDTKFDFGIVGVQYSYRNSDFSFSKEILLLPNHKVGNKITIYVFKNNPNRIIFK